MHVKYHEKHPFEREKTFSSNRKTLIHIFFMSDPSKTHLGLIGKFR